MEGDGGVQLSSGLGTQPSRTSSPDKSVGRRVLAWGWVRELRGCEAAGTGVGRSGSQRDGAEEMRARAEHPPRQGSC